jgi:hypothetical protein
MRSTPAARFKNIYVCTHQREDINLPGCGNWTPPEKIQELKTWLKSQGLHTKFKLTSTSCMGYCNAKGASCRISDENNLVFRDILDIFEIKEWLNSQSDSSQHIPS